MWLLRQALSDRPRPRPRRPLKLFRPENPALKHALLVAIFVMSLPLWFYGAGSVGAMLPGHAVSLKPGTEILIGIARGPFRFDLMLPLMPEVRDRYGFAKAQGLEIDNQAAEWLLLGRGGATMTRKPGVVPMFRAMLGDAAVIDMGLAGNVQGVKGLRFVTLSEPQFAALLAAVDGSFSRDQARAAVPAAPDRPLYAAVGTSSLLYNGNVWLGEVLLQAGVPFGRWTPTPQSVGFALDWHSG